MTKPRWVHVPGPCGRDTTVLLNAQWQDAFKVRAARGWHADYTTLAVKAAAFWLLQPGRYDAARDGAFSQAVRRRAYERMGR